MKGHQEISDDKLAKTADAVENNYSHVIDLGIQYQVDLLKDRVTRCESELKIYRRAYDIVCERVAAHAIETVDNVTGMQKTLDSSERGYSGLRALTIFSCFLSSIAITGVVLCVLYL